MTCKTCKSRCAWAGKEASEHGKRLVGYTPMTNADRIRGMTDEELAFWMTTNVTCCSCPVDLDACHNFEISGELSCEEILLNWLKAPVEEVEK